MFFCVKLALFSKMMCRPPAYSPAFVDRLIATMATRFSLDATAAEIGISPRTAYQWLRDISEFSKALEEGRAWALVFRETYAIAVASGEAGNTAIILRNLRNRSRSASA